MRLFIGSFAAIDDYAKIKHSFSFLRGKWVEKKNIHLTFLFLGEVPSAAPIVEALEGICYKRKDISLRGLGFFGTPPRVLWAGCEDESLTALHETIRERLGVAEKKPFIPHITLCRIKNAGRYERFLEAVRSYKEREIGHIKLKLQLIESHLTPKGPIYRPIHTF
ncbi:MAG: RNA 2',3'-cyclic phosphodiesterase [Epsilonproteobacteria bacterium]|nr:RNA 2',3'-cyclic phosphodiesterase [Campylobacterota bacterium]NPA63872.1 RNA 2',3'-cyclic phosphodiesterase [Campylobacterota bacterium]